MTDEEKYQIEVPKYGVMQFTATWCGPCHRIEPEVLELIKEFPDLNVVKIDVDEHNDLCNEHQITCMPTFIFFNNSIREHELDVSGADVEKIKENFKKLSELKKKNQIILPRNNKAEVKNG